ncbi:hypothetical protein CVT24_012889 [Panaeolus cyanescens]|uniref:DUF6593 domain-containing protein n=1 Tax=Panaeolus cyanescens TaxID=181874 RepID=A0A409WUS2_9AGAR|nr:hypothetical protein CVT24_012889 [Panaeolus cyanescens]
MYNSPSQSTLSAHRIQVNNESTETLVNPEPHVRLVMTKPSAISNVLLIKGRPRYKISTPDLAGNHTILSNARTGEILVRINRRKVFADEITFMRHYGGKTMKVGKEYMKETTSTLAGGGYNEMGYRDELGALFMASRRDYELPDDLSNPIAWAEPLSAGSEIQALLVPPGQEPFWDIVIGGWAYLQQKLRLEANKSHRDVPVGLMQAGMAVNLSAPGPGRMRGSLVRGLRYSDYDSTASAVTLVNSRPHSELVITKPSALNNVLLLNGKPRYIISTTDPAAAKTKITDARTKELLAKVHRRTIFSDEVMFTHHENGKPIKIGKEWFKESKMPDGRVRWDIETSSGNFAWRMDVVHRLVLCPASDMDNPIAWVQLPNENKSFAIIVPPGWESIWDIIIAGWVILEQKMRLYEKESQRAEGMATQQAQFATYTMMEPY